MLFAGDRTQEMYVQDLIERGGEAVTMAERLFKELTEDQIAFEMRTYAHPLSQAPQSESLQSPTA